MRLYYDPHYKRDRDHKKIMADKRRDERIRKELEGALKALLKPLPPKEKDPRTPEQIFAALRTAEKRVAIGLRQRNLRKSRGRKPSAFAEAWQSRKKSAASIKTYKQRKKNITEKRNESSRPLETVMADLTSAELKFEALIAELEGTTDKRREKLLRERMGHLKAKRAALRRELLAAGGSLLRLLNELEAQQRAIAERK